MVIASKLPERTCFGAVQHGVGRSADLRRDLDPASVPQDGEPGQPVAAVTGHGRNWTASAITWPSAPLGCGSRPIPTIAALEGEDAQHDRAAVPGTGLRWSTRKVRSPSRVNGPRPGRWSPGSGSALNRAGPRTGRPRAASASKPDPGRSIGLAAIVDGTPRRRTGPVAAEAVQSPTCVAIGVVDHDPAELRRVEAPGPGMPRAGCRARGSSPCWPASADQPRDRDRLDRPPCRRSPGWRRRRRRGRGSCRPAPSGPSRRRRARPTCRPAPAGSVHSEPASGVRLR